MNSGVFLFLGLLRAQLLPIRHPIQVRQAAKLLSSIEPSGRKKI
jgi:hypothetical protein